jgi:hypothetical protein
MTMSVPGSNGMMEKWSGGVLECWGGIEKSVFKSREDHTSTISHRPYLENIRYDAFQYSITPLLRFNERTITRTEPSSLTTAAGCDFFRQNMQRHPSGREQ